LQRHIEYAVDWSKAASRPLVLYLAFSLDKRQNTADFHWITA